MESSASVRFWTEGDEGTDVAETAPDAVATVTTFNADIDAAAVPPHDDDDSLADALLGSVASALVDDLFKLLPDSSSHTRIDAINSATVDAETKQGLVARYLRKHRGVAAEEDDDDAKANDNSNGDGDNDDGNRNFYEEHLQMAWEEMKRDGTAPTETPASAPTPRTETKTSEPRRILVPRRTARTTTADTLPHAATPMSHVSTLSAKERQEHMSRLAVPIVDRSTLKPRPPALSTSCPDLAPGFVEALQALDSLPPRTWHREPAPPPATLSPARSPFAAATAFAAPAAPAPSADAHTAPIPPAATELLRLPPTADRLRVTIAAEVDDAWRKQHKGAFRARAYTRNDACRSGNLRDPGALIDPAELKRQFSDQSATSSSSSSSSSSGATNSGTAVGDDSDPHQPVEASAKDQMRRFFGYFRLEFICLVLDLRMQVPLPHLSPSPLSLTSLPHLSPS